MPSSPEQVFATDVSQYAGQAVAMVIADTQEHANQMARAVSIKYKSMGKLILTIKDAIAAKSFYDEPGTDGILKIGDANGMIYDTTIIRLVMYITFLCTSRCIM